MKNLMFLLSILALFLFSSCGKEQISGFGPLVTKTIEVEAFTGILLDGAFQVEIIEGSTQQLIIETQDNLFDYINTSVHDGILEIAMKKGSYNDFDLNVFITTAMFNQLTLDGAGNIQIKDNFLLDQLHVSIDGAGSVRCNKQLTINNETKMKIDGAGTMHFQEVIGDDLELIIDGAGSFDIGGSSNDLTIEKSGAATVKAFDLLSQTSTINSDGIGDIEVNVEMTLDAKIEGVGSVYYKGNPTVHSTVDGLGRVIQVD